MRAHGYGWFIDTKWNKKMVEYSGCLIGCVSKIMRFVDDDVTLILYANVEDQDKFFKICDHLPEIIFN